MTPSPNGSEDGLSSMGSPLADEGGLGESSTLKKGPWTPAEDAILVEYVKQNGEGNWNAVQKNSGLVRCGKSCRLRWANHLRPNLKKGAFSSEEERKIIELHAKMGNKWARMAASLPGRTDNEIKNFWNTRIKRQLRSGLPLYPPDLCLQTQSESHQAQNTNGFDNGDSQHQGMLQGNNYEIPDVTFDNFNANQNVLSFTPSFPDVSMNTMLTPGLGLSQNNNNFIPIRQKRLREPESFFPGFNASFSSGLQPFSQFQSDTCRKFSRPVGFSFPYNPDPQIKNPIAFLNGNVSASNPIIGSMKTELPSFQYSDTAFSSWGTNCSLSPPSLESVDAFIQSPQVNSDYLSPRNNGLLESLLHQTQTLNTTKKIQFPDSSTNSSDIIDCSVPNVCETEWEDFGDPSSPLSHSAASVFGERTLIRGNLYDESPPTETLPAVNIKTEPNDHVSTPERRAAGNSTQVDYSNCRPDTLLGGDWLDQRSQCGKDAIETLLSEDICSDYKHMHSGTSETSQAWELGSIPWNNMPSVCQASEYM
ncbi:hypothetical protein GIB67_024710 [Kingdonia uniflora]|uniref:Transcription factor n=1 Tax=Kingdonia uniflora TaxID=39325 RepID=A0A7J7N9K5_9MAGN|nr:hypothetical protein GIB67_024710 [Kingdonia uniflora]